MSDLVAALGLVLMIEGVLYAGFPRGLKWMMAQAQDIPDATLRVGGLAAAALGLLVVWMVRG